MNDFANETDDSSALAWRPEAELAGTPPRTVKGRLRERISRWLFATLTLIVPVFLGFCAIVSQRTLTQLRDHGVETVGKVVERVSPKKDSQPGLVYEYQVDGKTYRVSESREKSVWQDTLLGAESKIRYLPENPGDAYTQHEFEKAGDTSPGAVACWIVAGILFVISGPFWIYIEKKFGTVRQLARFGMPTAGIITAVNRFGPSNYDQWKVNYAFAGADGSTREGKSYLYGTDVRKLGGVGSTATVLVDPNSDKRYELYQTVASLYRFVSDTVQN
jgi:hypothetical protein